MLFDNVITTPLAFARRDVLLKVGHFGESLPPNGKDHHMWGRVASRFPIARLSEVLGAHREHGGRTYDAGSACADPMRARVVGCVVESVLGFSIPLGTAMILGNASRSSDYTLEDYIVALALLEVLPHSAPWQWADGSTERRTCTRVLIDKLVVLAGREPRLKSDAMRAAARVRLMGPPRNIWDRATVRSLVRLALPLGGRLRCAALLTPCRRADSGLAGTRGAS